MSTARVDATATTTADMGLSPKQRRIYEYLVEHADGRCYFKSKGIGEALGLSAKEVGANMSAVANAATEVDVEKWGYSSGTTWMVTV